MDSLALMQCQAGKTLRLGRIIFFIDSNPELVGTQIDGIPVCSPDVLKDHDMPVYICSIAKKEIIKLIKEKYPHITMIP